jgi:hypothetical protein
LFDEGVARPRGALFALICLGAILFCLVTPARPRLCVRWVTKVERQKTSIRKAVITGAFFPVLAGSTFKNKGAQPLLDDRGLFAFAPRPAADRQHLHALPVCVARLPILMRLIAPGKLRWTASSTLRPSTRAVLGDGSIPLRRFSIRGRRNLGRRERYSAAIAPATELPRSLKKLQNQ